MENSVRWERIEGHRGDYGDMWGHRDKSRGGKQQVHSNATKYKEMRKIITERVERASFVDVGGGGKSPYSGMAGKRNPGRLFARRGFIWVTPSRGRKNKNKGGGGGYESDYKSKGICRK